MCQDFGHGLSRSFTVLVVGVRLANVNGIAIGGVKGSLGAKLDEIVDHIIALDAYLRLGFDNMYREGMRLYLYEDVVLKKFVEVVYVGRGEVFVIPKEAYRDKVVNEVVGCEVGWSIVVEVEEHIID